MIEDAVTAAVAKDDEEHERSTVRGPIAKAHIEALECLGAEALQHQAILKGEVSTVDVLTRIAKASGLDVPEGASIVHVLQKWLEEDAKAREVSTPDRDGFERVAPLQPSAEAQVVLRRIAG